MKVTAGVVLVHKEAVIRAPCRPPSDRLCCDEELGRKLAVAELEVLHLNELFKQVSQKYTEDVRKLEEKVEGQTPPDPLPQEQE